MVSKSTLLGLLVAPLLGAVWAEPAAACSVLSPRLEREAAEAKEDKLAEADKVLVGAWTFQPGERDDGGSRWGTITTPKKGKRPSRTYRALTFQDLSCGFPIYPQDDGTNQPQWGRFFLKRQRGADYFILIHFEPIERPK